MPDTRAATLVPITAIFRMKNGRPVLDMPEQIDTSHGMNQIVITLRTEPADGDAASFANTPPGPLCWLNAAGQSIAMPASFQVIREDQKLTIWDTNATSYTVAHYFWVVVEYKGTIYYQDPTIINQKPGQPTQPHR